ncbi:MAG: 30S ribosomal protein S12 methylthiotransferase RimO [Lachnospiraceae bacterium]|nr:30S ribosomal protein S12 methylthiotransferase RimO [Lachnospiraceae bacterium]
MKILFHSLGCDKNLADSEEMIGLLVKAGYEITDDEMQADGVVVNTCCFIHDAKQESVDTILEFAELKNSNGLKALIVTGCLAQRYADELLEEIPEIDALLGTAGCEEIVEALDNALNGISYKSLPDLHAGIKATTNQIVTTGGHYAYLKIAEGCDKHCTYCVIPRIRGSYRSVAFEELVIHAKTLVENHGVKELILVAQETTVYGVDLYGRKRLAELLDALNEIPGLVWIRILYCYPEEIDEELIAAIKRNKKVCHYLDVPIQHASDSVLKRMGRRTSQAELIEKIELLRREIPDICLRTTFITGFPGETQEDHEEAWHFINDIEFDRLGVFTYSREEETAADLLDGHLPEEIKEERRNELMELQQEIAFEKAEKHIGDRLLVMIEGALPEDGVYVGRTYMDAPNVDGFIFVKTNKVLMTGDFIDVVVTEANEYDLIGEPEDEYCQ